MSTPTPSWYDLLGVDPDADAEEVRAAWRAGIADLEPTDRRFTVLNQAAEVLLDPARRAAYDDEVAAQAPEPEPAVPADAEAVPAVPEEAVTSQHRGTGEPARPGRRPVPAWLLAGLAVLTLVVAGLATYVATQEPSDASIEEATSAARAAAERAVVPILSYDGKNLQESRSAAESYLTGDYREEYDRLFSGIIKDNAPSTGTVVTADLLRSGIVRSGEDRVQVFCLVDQQRTNKKNKQPVVFKNWVTVTMENVDGEWLVAGMDT